MVKKALLVFVLLLPLVFLNPSPTYAFEFDFFGLRSAVEELVYGSKQQEEQKPSIFQQFFNWVGSIWKKGDVLSPKSSPIPTPVNNPFPEPSRSPSAEPQLEERSLTPQQDGGPITKSTSQTNLTGKWGGDYVVDAPEACKGERGSWSANLAQTGNSLSGSYTSAVSSGSVSGNSSGTGVSWSVGGGDGGVSFKGSVTGPNSMKGTFVGLVCDEEEAPQKTTGTFFGGRL